MVLLVLCILRAFSTAAATAVHHMLTVFAVLCWQQVWSLADHAGREVTKLGLFVTASCAAAASSISCNLAVLAVRGMTVTTASAKCLTRRAASCCSAVATSAHSAWLQMRSRAVMMWPALWLHLDCLAHTVLIMTTIQTCVALLARQTFLPGGNIVMALYALSLLADFLSTASMRDLCRRVAAVPAAVPAMLWSAAHGVQSATADAAHSLANVSHQVLVGCLPASASAHNALLNLTMQAETLWPGCLFMAPLLSVAVPLLQLAGYALCLLLPRAAMTAVLLSTIVWLTVPIHSGALAPVVVLAHAIAALGSRRLGVPACHPPQATGNRADAVSDPSSPIPVPSSNRGQEQFKVLLYSAVRRYLYALLCSMQCQACFNWFDMFQKPLVSCMDPFKDKPCTLLLCDYFD